MDEGWPSISNSKSDWMDASNFIKRWLLLVSHLTESALVLPFLNGHHSYISLELIEESIFWTFVSFPHTTHLLQPLDVGVFAPVKAAWRVILKK